MAEAAGIADIGVYGLGTMGSALALNLAERGFTVAVTNREGGWIAPFVAGAGPLSERLVGMEDLASFVATIARPRNILMMISSGAPVDAMIAALLPLLEEGDTLIDGGNADFNDTRRRTAALKGTGVHFVGMGVSGGEEGARRGPSMMVGGSDHSWQHLRPMLEAIAARFGSDPCVAHVGSDGAGHFVKTVHNGIEYADMQMIAEVYGFLRDAGGQDATGIGALFAQWREGPLASYLVDVTATVLGHGDPETGAPLVDVIRDRAGQKGTGRWTLIEALKLGQSPSAIEAAVGARSWSSEQALRLRAEGLLPAGTIPPPDLPENDDLAAALLAGRILAHAQGFRLMAAASVEFGWQLDPARIAEIWRAGCIIRSALLDTFAEAFRAGPSEGELILAPEIAAFLEPALPGLRRVLAAAVATGVAMPALSAALAWYDTLRRGRGTANLIQAQRDFFGAHGFERLDREGSFHGDWNRTPEP
jgi:6-phosphogluconate dehydrogenase